MAAAQRGFVLVSEPRARMPGARLPVEVAAESGGALVARGPGFRLTAFGPEARGATRPGVCAPLVVTDRVALAWTGRIDDRAELARRLGRPALAAGGDGELLAEAYGVFGAGLARAVSGEFAFALVDRADGSIAAGADAIGVRRLHHHEDASGLVASPDLRLLLAALREEPALDLDALAEFVATGGAIRAPRTAFLGVRRLPPAHVLLNDGTGTRTAVAWRPDRAAAAPADSAELAAEVRRLLFRGVEGALRAEGPVWVDVSGGLDSSTVACVTGRLRPAGLDAGRVEAYSSVYSRDRESDESEYQEDVIAACGLERHTLDADAIVRAGGSGVAGVSPSTEILDPGGAAAVRALFAEHGVGVRLTGLGGDQVFCGDGFPPLYLGALLRAGRLGAWASEVRRWAACGERSIWNLVRRCTFGDGLSKSAGGAGDGAPPAWIAPGFRARALAAGAAGSAGDRIFADPGRELQRRLIHDITELQPDPEEAVEARHPLLFRPLVELLLLAPWSEKIRPDGDRVLQRRALAGILPERVRLRTSKGTSTSSFLRGIGRRWPELRRLAAGRRLGELGIVEPRAFAAACERLRHGLAGSDLRCFIGALSLEAWLGARENSGRGAIRQITPPGAVLLGVVA